MPVLTFAVKYTVINKNIYYSVEGGSVTHNQVHNEIKAIIAQNGLTLTEVVNRMNLQRKPDEQTTVQNISNKLTRGTIKFSEVLEIAELLGLRENKQLDIYDLFRQQTLPAYLDNNEDNLHKTNLKGARAIKYMNHQFHLEMRL